MRTIIVGANGLVGSAFARYFAARNQVYRVIGRAQQCELSQFDCDLLISCYGNANKRKAIAQPSWDFVESVSNLANYTHRIRAGLTVHISTIDVYSQPEVRCLTREDMAIDGEKLHSYGFHKYLAEQYVSRFSGPNLILRVPGLVGPGLRKNPVYDHYSPSGSLFIASESRLNFLHTDELAQMAMRLVEMGARGIFNVAARDSLQLTELARISGLPLRPSPDASATRQTYEICVDKVQQLLAMPSSESAIRRYEADLRALGAPMRQA